MGELVGKRGRRGEDGEVREELELELNNSQWNKVLVFENGEHTAAFVSVLKSMMVDVPSENNGTEENRAEDVGGVRGIRVNERVTSSI